MEYNNYSMKNKCVEFNFLFCFYAIKITTWLRKM